MVMSAFAQISRLLRVISLRVVCSGKQASKLSKEIKIVFFESGSHLFHIVFAFVGYLLEGKSSVPY